MAVSGCAKVIRFAVGLMEFAAAGGLFLQLIRSMSLKVRSHHR